MKKSLRPNLPTSGLFKQLANDAVSRHFRDGQAIFSQGDVANAIFRVEQGNVKLSFQPKRGRKAVIAVLREGECFGEGALISNALRISTATSIHRSTIGRVGKRAMTQRLHAEPAFAKLFTAHLLLRIGQVEGDLVDQLVNSSELRLARLLLQLCDFGRAVKGIPPAVHVDQGTLAEAVGTTRSRVSFFMNRFRQQGLIDYNGSIRVHHGLLVFLLGDSAAGKSAVS
ncbi:MAG: Crp/Fnr family transcriptional regulator [Terriglobales bacterium]